MSCAHQSPRSASARSFEITRGRCGRTSPIVDVGCLKHARTALSNRCLKAERAHRNAPLRITPRLQTPVQLMDTGPRDWQPPLPNAYSSYAYAQLAPAPGERVTRSIITTAERGDKFASHPFSSPWRGEGAPKGRMRGFTHDRAPDFAASPSPVLWTSPVPGEESEVRVSGRRRSGRSPATHRAPAARNPTAKGAIVAWKLLGCGARERLILATYRQRPSQACDSRQGSDCCAPGFPVRRAERADFASRA